MDVKENEYINLLFVEPPIENMCFTLGVCAVCARVDRSFLVCLVCLFVCVSFGFLIFWLLCVCGFFRVIFSHHNVECVNQDVDIYVHYVVLFSLSRFRFNFWLDAAEIRNHINITQEMHMFFLLLQSDEHHLCVIYIQMYSNTRVISRSFPPSFNSLSRVLTFLRVLCHHSLELHHSSCCLCLFYLRFFSESVWISEWIYFDTIFLLLVETLNTNLFAHFFSLPCVVFFLITTSYKTSRQSCRKNAAHAQFITRWCVYWSICNSLYFVYVFLQRI